MFLPDDMDLEEAVQSHCDAIMHKLKERKEAKTEYYNIHHQVWKDSQAGPVYFNNDGELAGFSSFLHRIKVDDDESTTTDSP